MIATRPMRKAIKEVDVMKRLIVLVGAGMLVAALAASPSAAAEKSPRALVAEAEMAQLRDQVKTLRSEIKRLEERLDRLEMQNVRIDSFGQMPHVYMKRELGQPPERLEYVLPPGAGRSSELC